MLDPSTAEFPDSLQPARGLAAFFERPANSFRWSGRARLRIDRRDMHFRATRRLMTVSAKKRRQETIGAVQFGNPAVRAEENRMSIAKVSEISATSKKGLQDAVQQGLKRANKTLRNIRRAWVKERRDFRVENGRITEYQVNMMVTFILDD